MSNAQLKKQRAKMHNLNREMNKHSEAVSDANFLDTRERHQKMKEIASNNPFKGKQNGLCNVTQCQRPNAVHFNHGTDAYYCNRCAQKIQAHCTGSEPLFTDLD